MSLPEPPASNPPDPGSDPFSLAPIPPAQERRHNPPPLPKERAGGHPVLIGVGNGLLLFALVEGLLQFAGCFPWVARGGAGFGVVLGLWSFALTLLFVWELFLICSYRGLPWVELSPLLAVIFWSRFLYLPLPGLFDWENLEFMGSLLMVATVGVSAWMLRQRRTVPWIPEASFEHATFSWGRSLWTFGLKFGVGVPVLVLYVAVSVAWMVDWRTHGFMRLDGTGIFLEARTYGRGREAGQVHLLPTAHIGTDRFYDRLMSGVPQKKAVLLPEGVTDQRGVLAARWSYAGPAKAVGLREQPDFSQRWSGVAVERCDVDVSELSLQTQDLLSRFSACLQRCSEGDWVGGADLLREVNVDRGAMRLLKRDILETRNARVTDCVQRVSTRFEHVLVPWGALHMAGIEGGLLKLGFEERERREVLMLEWREILPWVMKFSERP